MFVLLGCAKSELMQSEVNTELTLYHISESKRLKNKVLVLDQIKPIYLFFNRRLIRWICRKDLGKKVWNSRADVCVEKACVVFRRGSRKAVGVQFTADSLALKECLVCFCAGKWKCKQGITGIDLKLLIVSIRFVSV